MAADISKNPVGSPQEHIEMCKSHELPIDIICEDCVEFICSSCVKTDHRDLDWKTIPSAASQRRRGLLSFLKKIKEDNLPKIEEKIEKMSKQWIKNNELYDSEIKKLQEHFDEIVARMTEIRKRHENTSRDNLVKKNNQLILLKSELEKKKRGIVEIVEFMEKYNSTMSDYSLIDNHRELTKILSELEVNMTNCEHSVRSNRGEINDSVLESLFVKKFDLDDLKVTPLNSFQYADSLEIMLEALSEEKCYVSHHDSQNIEVVDKQGSKCDTFTITPNDMCVTKSSGVYFTDYNNKSISCLLPSGSVSTVISTDPLVPGGICQSVDGGLLVTLRDKESDEYKLESHSRRLVRHITVTGDVIHEYEYQEDGQTRLFTYLIRVIQNNNSDICVVNSISSTTGELEIMSSNGQIAFIYRGKNLTKDFSPGNAVCDSLCNILVTDPFNDQIHLLSPDGKFLKFLLKEKEVIGPFALSLRNSTLWVGCLKGFLSVFRYWWRGDRSDHDYKSPSKNQDDSFEFRDWKKVDSDLYKKDDEYFGGKENIDLRSKKKRRGCSDRERKIEDSRQFREQGASSWREEEKQRIDAWKKEASPTKRYDEDEEPKGDRWRT